MLINSVEIVVKKSRFIGLLYEVHSIDDVKDILAGLSKEHKKARHMPYAYKVSNTAKKSDDKEPSGTAGSPIYNILERKNMDNCLVVVIRYFLCKSLFQTISHIRNFLRSRCHLF